MMNLVHKLSIVNAFKLIKCQIIDYFITITLLQLYYQILVTTTIVTTFIITTQIEKIVTTLFRIGEYSNKKLVC
jgi:hypothetical protein